MQAVDDNVTMNISAAIVTVGVSANDCLMSCKMRQIYPTTGLVNSPNGLLTFREKCSKMTAEDLQNVKKGVNLGVSHPPTFKPKAVNGKRLVAANHQTIIFYNVVVWDTPVNLWKKLFHKKLSSFARRRG